MEKAIIRIFILTLLFGNFIASTALQMTVTVPPSLSLSSSESHHHHHHHHVEGSRCKDMRGGLSLNLRNVGLRRLDSGFTNSPHISCLNLEDNDITYISPSSFNLMPNLQYLNLARNNLSLANFAELESHLHLRTLILDDNLSIENINLDFNNTFPSLYYLYLSNCSISNIVSFTFAPWLEYLNLSANNLGNSNLTFFENAPQSLKILDLTNNSIENFDVSSLSSLVTLCLDGNKFERLCGKSYCINEAVLTLKGAVNLQRFSVSRNSLTNVDSDAFDATVNITHLDLSYNKIDSIQKGTFEKLDDMEHLSLEGNMLKMIPELCNLESLRHLHLAKNYLRVVNNDSFCEIDNLTYVDLSDNKIKLIENGAFDTLVHLEILKLSNNLIKTFPNSWLERLKFLKRLYVDGNQLKTLSDIGLGSVRMFAKLQSVFAQNNKIDKLYTGSLNSEFKNHLNATIQLYDFESDTSNKNMSSEEVNKCECIDINEV